MAKPTGFIEYDRRDVRHRRVAERLGDFFEIDIPHSEEDLITQAARCMDCGIPFCHGYGCPVMNRIPEFNDLVYHDRWEEACEILHRMNNFPEITGRICPAPCEAACTLNLNSKPVLIRHIELQIVEKGWENGWIVPRPAEVKTGKRVAIIGSGPAGLAAAQQLAREGHEVTVFEKDEKPGGLLRFGIPDFKLDKRILDRRLNQMRAEGVQFETSVTVGDDLSLKYLRKRFDAILLSMGAGEPRNLDVPGRGLENVHFALEFLTQQNRINAGLPITGKRINAEGKVVAVIGGGDTGSDCIGTSNRQGAKEVFQFEILPEPPKQRAFENPWPTWPNIYRTSTSQEEGCTRQFCVLTKKLSGLGATVRTLHGCKVEWKRDDAGRMSMKEVPGSEFTMDVDLVLLAMGFVHVVHKGLVEELGVDVDQRGNIAIDENFMSSQPGVFAAGDTRRGASLVVWGIRDGRDAAAGISRWLKEKK